MYVYTYYAYIHIYTHTIYSMSCHIIQYCIVIYHTIWALQALELPAEGVAVDGRQEVVPAALSELRVVFVLCVCVCVTCVLV